MLHTNPTAVAVICAVVYHFGKRLFLTQKYLPVGLRHGEHLFILDFHTTFLYNYSSELLLALLALF